MINQGFCLIEISFFKTESNLISQEVCHLNVEKIIQVPAFAGVMQICMLKDGVKKNPDLQQKH